MIINLAAVNWGPQFFVPTLAINRYCGCVILRGNLDDELLKKELEDLAVEGYPKGYSNVWYIRRRGAQTWIRIGESFNRDMDFGVRLDTAGFDNGTYQILGFLSVTVKTQEGEVVVSRQSIADLEIRN
jgi:hypothetical protein